MPNNLKSEDTRDSFIFYRSFYESLKPLSDSDKIVVYEAIADYCLNDNEPELNGLPLSFFTLMKPVLDKNKKQYQNGKKGGRPRANPKPNNNPTETQSKPKNNPMETQPKPYKDKDKDKDKDSIKKELTIVSSKKPQENKIDFDEIKNAWNKLDWNIPKVITMNNSRKTAIKKRIEENGLDGVRKVIDFIKKSSFHQGANSREWVANIDWIFKRQNFLKILEQAEFNKKPKPFEEKKTKTAWEAIQDEEKNGEPITRHSERNF